MKNELKEIVLLNNAETLAKIQMHINKTVILLRKNEKILKFQLKREERRDII